MSCTGDVCALNIITVEFSCKLAPVIVEIAFESRIFLDNGRIFVTADSAAS